MIWLSHKKYTVEYVSEQLVAIRSKVRRETRRMIYVAAFAVGVMVTAQTFCLVDILSAS
ncbi:hypothetical protein [uncultured Pseudodesulfovibrio sp.]|uniref:hypothetical protein n=1 Tax=uncultured Pseudodesulfovibrio sp. TaxID=2035858 RepID=UPI0029C7882C|nr:hypothetical protein [uncultured Pseudodesulfovibrio sp.]